VRIEPFIIPHTEIIYTRIYKLPHVLLEDDEHVRETLEKMFEHPNISGQFSLHNHFYIPAHEHHDRVQWVLHLGGLMLEPTNSTIIGMRSYQLGLGTWMLRQMPLNTFVVVGINNPRAMAAVLNAGFKPVDHVSYHQAEKQRMVHKIKFQKWHP